LVYSSYLVNFWVVLVVGELSSNQFGVLHALLGVSGSRSQRWLAGETGLGLGTVNAVLRELRAAGLASDSGVTEAGLAALEPYRVDNAVIMAAGLSQRFAPISYEKPKGLLRVRGEVLIERQIRQLLDAGIGDITVVVGYKKEYFFYLGKKFGVKIVVNSEFASRNNNGTLWAVRDRLANTYVCSSDNYFTENPFETFVYDAYYAATWVDGPTEEWCVGTGPGGRITNVEIGGRDAPVMLGQAYFDAAFSKRFIEILASIYNDPDTVSKLWESVFIEHADQLDMRVRLFDAGLIHEFDSLDELSEFDPEFIENVDSKILDRIASTLDCSRSQIGDFFALKQGLTNLSCHFTVDGEQYVYRHPGAGTEKLVDRSAEKAALELARELELDSTFLTADASAGWKISRFIPNARNLEPTDPGEVTRAMEMMRTLHDSGAVMDREFNFVDQGQNYQSLLEEFGPIDVPGYWELAAKVQRLKNFTDRDGFAIVPSHNDFFHLNFILDEEDVMHLIDWEYAGMSDEANDYGTFAVCSQFDKAMSEHALKAYFGRTPTERERRHFGAYVVFAGWCWYVWSLLKEREGDDVGEWLYIYYRHAVDALDELLAEYQQAEEMTTNPDSTSGSGLTANTTVEV